MIILGIDPGLRTCGFALLEVPRSGDMYIRDVGLWVTMAEGTLRERLAELRGDVRAYLAEHQPAIVVAEVPTYPRDAVSAAMLWASYAAIGALAEASGARWCEMTTTAWRAALGLPVEPSGAPRIPKNASKEQRKALERERERCARKAKARRKATTRALMVERFPGVRALLESTPADLQEHPFDALAIGCAWSDRATATQTAPTSAQGELAW